MSKKIKILFFIPQLVGGGAEKVTINIMRILDENIFDIHLAVTATNGPSFKYLPSNITIHDMQVKKTLFSIWKLRKLINNLNVDIVFSSLIRGHIAIDLALKGKSKPYIVFRSPNSPKLLFKYKQIGKIQNFFLKIAYSNADLIVAQTPEMKEEIIHYYKMNSQKVVFLMNPLDIESINVKIKNITNPFDSNYINIIAAGRITYQKGFDILIKSFVNIIKENTCYRLFIIGNDNVPEVKELEQLIDKYELGEYITFLGYKENPYQYFYFADLYVLSSRWEGLPNTVLENIYLQKPIVATKCIPYMSTLIKDGNNGFLVDINNTTALSEAILNYKKLTLEFTPIDDMRENVNRLFLDNYSKKLRKSQCSK